MSWLSSHLDPARLADLQRDPLWRPLPCSLAAEARARAAYAAVIAAYRAECAAKGAK